MSRDTHIPRHRTVVRVVKVPCERLPRRNLRPTNEMGQLPGETGNPQSSYAIVTGANLCLRTFRLSIGKCHDYTLTMGGRRQSRMAKNWRGRSREDLLNPYVAVDSTVRASRVRRRDAITARAVRALSGLEPELQYARGWPAVGRRSERGGVAAVGRDRIQFTFKFEGVRYRPTLPIAPNEVHPRRVRQQLACHRRNVHKMPVALKEVLRFCPAPKRSAEP
jgi:hypothetical protein